MLTHKVVLLFLAAGTVFGSAFKARYPQLADRQARSRLMRDRNPDTVPVICEKAPGCGAPDIFLLPGMDKYREVPYQSDGTVTEVLESDAGFSVHWLETSERAAIMDVRVPGDFLKLPTRGEKALFYAKEFVQEKPYVAAGGAALAVGGTAALAYYLSKTDEPVIVEPEVNGSTNPPEDTSCGTILGLGALGIAGAYGIYKYFFQDPKANQQPEQSESPAEGTEVAQTEVPSQSATPTVSQNARTARTSQKAKPGKKGGNAAVITIVVIAAVLVVSGLVAFFMCRKAPETGADEASVV